MKARGHYPLPKVAAARTPQLDPYIKSEVPHQVKCADKDLAKIQTFVLDALAPLVSILDLNSWDHCPAYQDTIDTISTAVELLGNASATISHLRQEKVTLGLNRLSFLYVRSMKISNQQLQHYLAQTLQRGPRSTFIRSRPCSLLYHLDPQNSFFDLPLPKQSGGYHPKPGRGRASNYFQRRNRDHQQFNAKRFQRNHQTRFQNKNYHIIYSYIPFTIWKKFKKVC